MIPTPLGMSASWQCVTATCHCRLGRMERTAFRTLLHTLQQRGGHKDGRQAREPEGRQQDILINLNLKTKPLHESKATAT